MEMDLFKLFNMIVAVAQQNHGKVSIEALKDAIDKSNMPSEDKDFYKSYIDLGYDYFEERNYDKATSECLYLIHLIDKCQKQ